MYVIILHKDSALLLMNKNRSSPIALLSLLQKLTDMLNRILRGKEESERRGSGGFCQTVEGIECET